MNHDHPYIDYNEAYFHRCVDFVFRTGDTGFQKVFVYTHAPETAAINIASDSAFLVDENLGLYFSYNVEDTTHVCAIYVMTLETLRYIWNNINFKGGEIGRIDWKGATYSDLKIKAYSSCREFFKHFDGYGHITGLENIGKLELNRPYPIQFPHRNNDSDIYNEEIIELYYSRWMSVFLLSLRAILAKKYFFFTFPKKSEFISSVELTLGDFLKCYIQADIDSKLLTTDESNRIFSGLRSRIYSHGNNLYAQLVVEIILLRGSAPRHILQSLYRICPETSKIVMRWLYNKMVKFMAAFKQKPLP
jgi:hypothetical protein